MKNIFFVIVCMLSTALCAQTAEEYFVASASQYVQNQNQLALQEVEAGLKEYPDNIKLKELKKIIEQEKENNQKQPKEQNKGQDPNQDNQEEGEENNSQQQSGEQDGRNQGEQGTGSSDKNPLNEDGGQEESESRGNQGERLQEQRYENILKALENQEQETQRRLILGDSKSKLGRKQKDW